MKAFHSSMNAEFYLKPVLQHTVQYCVVVGDLSYDDESCLNDLSTAPLRWYMSQSVTIGFFSF